MYLCPVQRWCSVFLEVGSLFPRVYNFYIRLKFSICPYKSKSKNLYRDVSLPIMWAPYWNFVYIFDIYSYRGNMGAFVRDNLCCVFLYDPYAISYSKLSINVIIIFTFVAIYYILCNFVYSVNDTVKTMTPNPAIYTCVCLRLERLESFCKWKLV